MSGITRLSFLILLLFYFSAIGIAMAGDAVSFSGVVKKVIADKNKVGIKDPETKKRFTVIVNEKTQPDGLKTLSNLKKKDKVEGKYTVTDAGLYIALELVKK
jgi:23S rRNA maturation mini-RNase III